MFYLFSKKITLNGFKYKFIDSLGQWNVNYKIGAAIQF